MVLYARSDIIREQPVGGCGKPHIRPVIGKDNNGEDQLAPVWGIDCPPCEAVLAGRVTWSRKRHQIPLTPDQEEEAEGARQMAQAALERQQALAAQKVAELGLRNAQAGDDGIDPADVHITSAEDGDGPSENEENPSGGMDPSDLRALDKSALKQMAAGRGLPVGGTKDDLVSRLAEYRE
jgi:hypothetical protein